MAVNVLPATYDEVAHLKDLAKKEDAHVYEGTTPIIWFKAVVDGVVVGSSGMLRASQKEARLRGWYVLPEYRHRGIGRMLCEIVEDEARDRGFAFIEAKTRYHDEMLRWGWEYTGREYPSWPIRPGRQYVKRFDR